jgi:hypothetical protein
MSLKDSIESISFVQKIASMRKLFDIVSKHPDKYGYFEVKKAYRGNVPKVFVENIDTICGALAVYGEWKESGFSSANNPSLARDAVKGAFDAASSVFITANEGSIVDPYTLFDVSKITENFDKVSALWMTFELIKGDHVSNVLRDAFNNSIAHIINTFVTYIDSLGLKLQHDEIVNELRWCERNDVPLPEVVKHDEIVYLTPSEREMIAREEARKKEEERQEAARIDRINEVSEKAAVIKQCYDQHKKCGSLEFFAIDEDIYESLSDKSKMLDNADKIESLWKLLMAMSESVRFMPGEKGSDYERIIGSIMELEKDVCTYHTRFLMSTGCYSLTHNDVVTALSTIKFVVDNSSSPIHAQYVDTKKYIDQEIDSEKNCQTVFPKSFHLFI